MTDRGAEQMSKETRKETDMKRITVDGVKYVEDLPHGEGWHICVLDRGFIFAGNLTVDKSGLHTLTDCVNVRRWEKGGFGGMTKSPKACKAVLDPSEDISFRHPIMVVPVSEGWKDA